MDLLESYKHCTYCGGKVTASDRKFTCTTCKGLRYVNPSPAVTALIFRNNEILLVKRAINPSKNKWDFPGGFVDLNENYEDAIKREMMEELGIKLKNIKYFNSITERYLFKGVNEYVLVVNFLAEIESGNLKPDDDVSEAKFFELNEALNVDLGFPSMKKVISELIDFRADS
jgi:mutator protein MutT